MNNVKKINCSECGTSKCYVQVSTDKDTFHIDKKGNVYDLHFDDTEENLTRVLDTRISSSGCCEKCEEYLPVIITLKDGSAFSSAETEKLGSIQR